MSREEYYEAILELLKNIKSINILRKAYTFIKYLT